MSQFLKALEQAEHDRALREGGKSPVPTGEPAETPAAAEAAAPAPTPVIPRVEPALPRAEPDAGLARTVDEHLVSLMAPLSPEAEQYRALRHLVEQFHQGGEVRVFGISSAGVGDGKTTTAINLAGSLAQSAGHRVLLIDADLRRSSVMRYLGRPSGGPGLADAIMKPGLWVRDLVQPCPPYNLSIVPAGRVPSGSYEVLKSPRLGELFDEAREAYDFVIVDMPPLVPFSDCRLVSPWVDGFLVVVGADHTPRKLLSDALAVMDQARILGLIFNDDGRALTGYTYEPSGAPRGNMAAARLAGIAQRAGASLKRRLNRARNGGPVEE